MFTPTYSLSLGDGALMHPRPLAQPNDQRHSTARICNWGKMKGPTGARLHSRHHPQTRKWCPVPIESSLPIDYGAGIVVQSVHTLAGEGDLGKLIGKLVRPIGGSVVVPITENAVSVTITAQVFDDRKLRNRPGARA